jgi:hypothetical protein
MRAVAMVLISALKCTNALIACPSLLLAASDFKDMRYFELHALDSASSTRLRTPQKLLQFTDNVDSVLG